MNVFDFQQFIKLNFLKKIEVAEYLGVSPSYISKVLNGEPISPDKLRKLLEHPSWDTSMLLREEQSCTGDTQSPDTTSAIATADGEVIEAEVVERPIVPTAVVRQPEVRLSKWIDKYSDEVERLRLSEIIRTASMVREVKDRDMAPSLKVGQYIYLELMPRDMPIKNGRIYFVDHKKVEGFFRRLYDRGDSIECRADKPAIEPNTYSKEDIFDIYKVVGVFSTDIIDDEEGLAKDLQIASLTEQLNRLMAQQDTHIKNTTEALAGTNKVIEQQGILIDLLKKS